MINLLPPNVKENILYARRNTRLRRWIMGLLFSIAIIAATVGMGYLYLQRSINSYAVQVSQGEDQLKAQKLEETQTQVQDLTNSLKLVVQVLSREILFSKLLTQVGAALPNGSVLTDLSINKVSGGLDLRAAATDYQTATQVQVNLQDPSNKIFEKADIINIQCANQPAGGDPVKVRYPCTIQLRALFAQNNPFSFISTGAKQ
ncbi:MAG TPA: hypothetical protein VM124_01500 [Candidatus Limnocylindrales bacterium]|nr:hypothetical protein [Candidatus Limnocylindrales bacterium]